MEFIEAKDRRQRILMARKHPGYVPQASHRPRIRRTGDLVFDQPRK
jgi:hypothetical protein